jgi:V-ATPase subunit H
MALEDKNLLFSSISSPLHEFIDWLISQLQLSVKSLSIILPGLTTIITSTTAKTIFGRQGCVGYICHHLRVPRSIPSRNKQKPFSWHTDEELDERPGQLAYDSLRSIQLTQIRSTDNGQQAITSQQQYELLYCLWVISLDLQISLTVREYFQREDSVPVLADLIAVSPREKSIRVALSILKNLAQCDNDKLDATMSTTSTAHGSSTLQLNSRISFLDKMIGCGILKSIQFMTTCVWNDQEMQNGTCYHRLTR